MPLNLLTVIGIKAATKPKIRDGGGLWLHESKSGRRYWVFIFTRNERRREMGLGPYGTEAGEVPLAAARMKANEIRSILRAGGDPFKEMKERQKLPQPISFGEVADDYIDAMKSKWKGAKTEASWRNCMTIHAKSLRKIPVAEITTDEVKRCLLKIWSEKQETASKLRERIETVLDAAKVDGHRTGDNPARWKGHLDKVLPAPDKEKRGHHAAMPHADVADFIAKLTNANGMGARALEFAILTAARSGEVRGAKWSEIDAANAVWRIPKNRMKSRRDHNVALSRGALDILEKMRQLQINDLVFPSVYGGKVISDMTIAKALKTAGAGEFTVHGFRSSFRNWVAEMTDFQTEIAEAALSHTTGDEVVRAYLRSDVLEKRRVMMEQWAIYCGAIN